MNILQQYKASLKAIEIEEIADLVFFRPLAFVFVKLFYHTSLTPNHISLISMSLGVLAGVALAFATTTSFVVAGIIYLLATAIDCSDGMIARLKKNGTKIGRLIDGGVDYVTTFSVYVGLFIGLGKLTANNEIDLMMEPWLLVLIFGILHTLHSILTDYYRNAYEYQVFNKPLDTKSQLDEFEKELKGLNRKNGKFIEKAIVRLYIKYCRLQAIKKAKATLKFDPVAYARYNRPLVFFWNVIGPSQHVMFLALSLIFFEPMLFFWFVVVFANLWTIVLLGFQKFFEQKLKEKGLTLN